MAEGSDAWDYNERYVELTCSDRGKHTPAVLQGMVIGSDGAISSDTTRERRVKSSPWSDDGADGPSVPTKQIVVTGSSRADHGGRERWRLLCSRCGRDKPLNEASMVTLLQYAIDNGRRAVDVSLLP